MSHSSRLCASAVNLRELKRAPPTCVATVETASQYQRTIRESLRAKFGIVKSNSWATRKILHADIVNECRRIRQSYGIAGINFDPTPQTSNAKTYREILRRPLCRLASLGFENECREDTSRYLSSPWRTRHACRSDNLGLLRAGHELVREGRRFAAERSSPQSRQYMALRLSP